MGQGDDAVGERAGRSLMGYVAGDDEPELHHTGGRAVDGLLQVER